MADLLVRDAALVATCDAAAAVRSTGSPDVLARHRTAATRLQGLA